MSPKPYDKLHSNPATVRQRRSQQLSTLRGIVEGIACDRAIMPSEREYLNRWLDEHQGQAEQAHYSKLIAYLQSALEDDRITQGEQAEILEHIEEIKGDAYYDLLTSAMQEFHGILGGIAADGQIVDSEVRMLRGWMNDHEYLANHWPFTETDSLLTSILADRQISSEEHEVLLSWCGAFVDITSHKTLVGKATGFGATLRGITAVAPSISFHEKSFCLTGASAKASRQTIEDYIESLGGAVMGSIRQDLDYLVYCDAGQKCWAYACYGRKVESVMENRKAGRATTLILAEVDVWDALADAGIEHRKR